MKIFLPFKNTFHPYLQELIKNSGNNFIYGLYKNYEKSFNFVNIHWPEAIFDWKEPSDRDLEEFEEAIREWKKNSVLIYTKHDFQRNKGTTPNFTRLFNLVEKHTHIFIHLGNFSKTKYEAEYPQARHELVHHPLFKSSKEVTSKSKARQVLGIDKKAKVIITPVKFALLRNVIWS